jgi:hypothetical protein
MGTVCPRDSPADGSNETLMEAQSHTLLLESVNFPAIDRRTLVGKQNKLYWYWNRITPKSIEINICRLKSLISRESGLLRLLNAIASYVTQTLPFTCSSSNVTGNDLGMLLDLEQVGQVAAADFQEYRSLFPFTNDPMQEIFWTLKGRNACVKGAYLPCSLLSPPVYCLQS